MTTEEIYNLLIQYFPQLAVYTWIPAIIAVAAVIFMVLKQINEFHKTTDAIKNKSTEISQLKKEIDELKAVNSSAEQRYSEVSDKLNILIEDKTKIKK